MANFNKGLPTPLNEGGFCIEGRFHGLVRVSSVQLAYVTLNPKYAVITDIFSVYHYF